jgi:phosphoribosyl-ATP pyrophosphohydrolase
MKLEELYQIIESRKQADAKSSYTARLFEAGEDEIIKKVGEEAVEVVLAASRQGDARLVEELADLTYHVLVLLSARGLKIEDILNELERRHR